MTQPTRASESRPAVEALLESWRQAINQGDIDGITECYSEDIVVFDAIMALEFTGKAPYRQHWQDCLAVLSEPLRFEIRQRQLFLDTASAHVSALVHCSCRDEHGKIQGGWMRLSQHLRQIDGQWRIVHEHFSVPFDMPSGKVLFDLEPADRAA
jgi:ketosteroid isomerase-like protein